MNEKPVRVSAWRPAGYLAVTIVWSILFLVTIGIVLALPLALHPPISRSAAILGLRDGGAGNFLAFVVAVFLALPAAYAAAFMLPLITASQVLLAALAFRRSLDSGYAGERLTGTMLRNDGIGFRATPMAMSLLPRRHTGYSNAVAHLNFRSWSPGWRWFLGLWAFSYAYLLALWIVLWPVRVVAGVVAIVVVGAALVVCGFLLLRAGWGSIAVDASGPLPRPVLSPRAEAAAEARAASEPAQAAKVESSSEQRKRSREQYRKFRESAKGSGDDAGG